MTGGYPPRWNSTSVVTARLPRGPGEAAYSFGFNCTGSEMGRLFYRELGNPAGERISDGLFRIYSQTSTGQERLISLGQTHGSLTSAMATRISPRQRHSAIGNTLGQSAQKTCLHPDRTASLEHIFPQIADGDGFRSTLLATNVSTVMASCVYTQHGIGLDRFADFPGVEKGLTTMTFSLPQNGGNIIIPSLDGPDLACGLLGACLQSAGDGSDFIFAGRRV